MTAVLSGKILGHCIAERRFKNFAAIKRCKSEFLIKVIQFFDVVECHPVLKGLILLSYISARKNVDTQALEPDSRNKGLSIP